MKQKIYQIDAFASEVFKGNPAAVCILDKSISEKLMQQIAMENNLSETAFVEKKKDKYLIRWFTPNAEVALCGHATLASAFVLFNHYEKELSTIEFETLYSGNLRVKRSGNSFILDFPADRLEMIESPKDIENALGIQASESYRGKTDLMFVLGTEAEVRELKPDFALLKGFDQRGYIVTAPGENRDFVSRFFCPALGIDEDPVTGSAHTSLTPYWSKRLGKKKLSAAQLSMRGGLLDCEDHGERVHIGGGAVLYMEAIINI